MLFPLHKQSLLCKYYASYYARLGLALEQFGGDGQS